MARDDGKAREKRHTKSENEGTKQQRADWIAQKARFAREQREAKQRRADEERRERERAERRARDQRTKEERERRAAITSRPGTPARAKAGPKR